jgi:glutamine---fructose-6-phosphate transaminase (isomerizing)
MPVETLTSLDAMRVEIEGQVEGLREYSRYLVENRKPFESTAEEMVFVGSGDSYSAALWAHEMSRGKATAYDPFELGLKPSWAQHKHVFIISVTGRTRANVFLARRLKGVAARRVAITSSLRSELASECDETIELQYRRGQTLTSGTASYTASLLACAQSLGLMPDQVRLDHNLHARSLIGHLPQKGSVSPELEKLALNKQLKQSKLICRDGIVLFIGTGTDYPLAYYAALKFNEVLGLKAFPSYPEPIGHSLLFSLNPEKDRIVILDPSSNRRLREVNKILSGIGFSIYEIPVPPQNPLSRTMELAFEIQMLAHNLARGEGMKECAFLSDRDRLETSNNLIY